MDCWWEGFSSDKRQFNAKNSDEIISETERFFWIFSCIFEIYIKFWTFLKKDDRDSWFFSENTQSGKRG